MTTSTGLLPAASVLHAHLADIMLAEADRFGDGPVQLLDCGCGDGRLLELALSHVAPRLEREISPWGFDVDDEQIQFEGFMARTADRLRSVHPDVPWDDRLSLISSSERIWPYADETFDLIVSNQVCEHVEDLDLFFSEVGRTLRTGGISVHVFPLRDYVVEGHTGVPFADWITSHDSLVSYLRAFGGGSGIERLGPRRRNPTLSRDEHAEVRADLIVFHTWYRRLPEVACAAKRAGLRISYRYTPELYALKLGYVLDRDFSSVYRRTRNPIVERLLFSVAKRISSVTIFLEKLSTYDPESL